MKIIAFYLPQFHNIPENDEWWGDGFTEWVNVKKAEPLFPGHNQPKVPYNNNYYDLTDERVQIWQSELAKKYGVYGFAYYHYWFDGKLLLERPMEQMLANKKITTNFCISWANEPWTKAWVGDSTTFLIPQRYGEKKEWKQHYDYLRQFFLDERYIKDKNRPLFIIYRPEVIPCLNDMLDFWDACAKEDGFDGMCFAYQTNTFDLVKNHDASRFDYNIEFQPGYATMALRNDRFKLLRKIRRTISSFVEKKTGIPLSRYGQAKFDKLMNKNRMDYDEVWQQIIKTKPKTEKNLPGAFVAWDNTPRHGKNARIYYGDTPQKFEKYLSQQVKNAKDIYNTDYLFITAWNEWAEGSYLEPDKTNGYGYLEAIQSALKANHEFPSENG